MPGVLHLGNAKVNRIQQRGAVAASHRGQPGLDIFNRIGEVFNQFRPVVEADHEKLILGIGGLDELQYRLAGADQLRSHGTGKIEDDSDRNRRVLAGEADDLLAAVVFENLKVFLLQAGDQAVHGIGHGHRDQHHVHVHADA